MGVKKIKRNLTVLLIFCLTMGVMNPPAFAEERNNGNITSQNSGVDPGDKGVQYNYEGIDLIVNGGVFLTESFNDPVIDALRQEYIKKQEKITKLKKILEYYDRLILDGGKPEALGKALKKTLEELKQDLNEISRKIEDEEKHRIRATPSPTAAPNPSTVPEPTPVPKIVRKQSPEPERKPDVPKPNPAPTPTSLPPKASTPDGVDLLGPAMAAAAGALTAGYGMLSEAGPALTGMAGKANPTAAISGITIMFWNNFAQMVGYKPEPLMSLPCNGQVQGLAVMVSYPLLSALEEGSRSSGAGTLTASSPEPSQPQQAYPGLSPELQRELIDAVRSSVNSASGQAVCIVKAVSASASGADGAVRDVVTDAGGSIQAASGLLQNTAGNAFSRAAGLVAGLLQAQTREPQAASQTQTVSAPRTPSNTNPVQGAVTAAVKTAQGAVNAGTFAARGAVDTAVNAAHAAVNTTANIARGVADTAASIAKNTGNAAAGISHSAAAATSGVTGMAISIIGSIAGNTLNMAVNVASPIIGPVQPKPAPQQVPQPQPQPSPNPVRSVVAFVTGTVQNSVNNAAGVVNNLFGAFTGLFQPKPRSAPLE